MAVLKNGKFPTLLFWVKYKLGLAREGVDFVAVPIPKVKALVDALECPQNEGPWCKDCPYAVWGFQGHTKLSLTFLIQTDHCFHSEHIPQQWRKVRLGMVAHAFNPSICEAEANLVYTANSRTAKAT